MAEVGEKPNNDSPIESEKDTSKNFIAIMSQPFNN